MGCMTVQNRYALMENLNNPQQVELKNTYKYHRLALDTLIKHPIKAGSYFKY
jgi:hypothetical protein